ncbi:hypothetical protein HYW20_01905 [Candidatus Woesearchaeota archaeon]|nr:hypothetical protein [Candidatus Woesearchaeota archaeon]
MQSEKQNLRVVIFPLSNGYVASCLDLCLVAEEKTQEEAARGITELINANISLVKGEVPTKKFRFPPATFLLFEQGKIYDYTPRLPQQVKRRYGGIEFRAYSG